MLVHVMSLDIPLTTLANTIQLAGVMEGKHSVDTGLLAMPVLIEMMQLIGDKNGVEYDSGLKNETLDMANSPLVERAITKELKEEMGEGEEGVILEDDVEMAEEPMVEEKVIDEEPKGLMF